MILAAGFGTRLLPHTLLKPKPLFPILNQPLLLLTVNRLRRNGFDRIIVNCHHLKEQIVEALAGIDGVIIQQEETILGTGGGLRQALSQMHNEPLLVTNGDIYHTIDYRALYSSHQENACCATLAMHDYPRFNKVPVCHERVVGFDNMPDCDLLAFTGLHVIEPEILVELTDGASSCIIERYKKLLAQGESLGVYRTDQSYWTDMGTPEAYLALHEGLLTGNIPMWKELKHSVNGSCCVSENAQLLGESQIDGWCSIGAVTGRDSALSGVVIWDGVQLPDGFTGENALISSSPASLQGDAECIRGGR